MRVLMLGPDRSVHGGISQMVNNYYDSGLDQKVELRYIGTMVEGSKFRKLLQAVWAYIRFCVHLGQSRIVHVNMASDASYYRKSVFVRTARLCGKKLIIHQHGGDFETFYGAMPEKKQAKVRRVLNMADVFIVLTPALADFFAGLVDEKKIVVLPNGVAVGPRPQKTYEKHRILFLGRLCRQKGIGELMTAVSHLRSEFPDMQVMLGGIWEDPELRDEVARLSGTVEYLGWIEGERKQRYLDECEIFVLPSYFEGMPVSVLEAMASCCAVVASAVGGIPQMLEDGVDGILIRPKDSASLEEGLRRVLSQPLLGREMGNRARAAVEKDFSLDRSIDRLLGIYRNLSDG